MNRTSAATDRIVALDVIRGIAVMGIFSVNVIAFAFIEPAYFNPPTMGGHSGADLATWAVNAIIIDGKMRSLFSMLFGASVLLVIDRARASGRSPAATHFARMLVLGLIGLTHFYLIWWGDILFSYAAAGCVLYLFRNREPKTLLCWSAGLFFINAALLFALTTGLQSLERAAHAPNAAAADVREWQEQTRFITATPDEAARQIAIARSGIGTRVGATINERGLEPLILLAMTSGETIALMLLGMALFRMGFLTGEWPDHAYRRTSTWTLAIGIPATALLAFLTWSSGFDVIAIMTNSMVLSTPLRPLMAVGYAALIILLARNANGMRDRIAAVGRCAFTNYLGTSILASLIFFGDGLGLFARLSRFESWLFVPLFWVLMLAWSKPWLDRFRYGPLEWLWRSLARLELQPMRKQVLAAA
ncbi:MAG: DUF418 domain-containing protein [Sphingomicrobium sp.]